MMVNDHGKANAELKALAEKEGLTVPTSLDEEHAALVKTLEKAGDQFDAAYAKAQLDAHEAAVELFENYASKGENKELQMFAVATLPTLHGHLEKIKEIGSRTAATQIAVQSVAAAGSRSATSKGTKSAPACLRGCGTPVPPGNGARQ